MEDDERIPDGCDDITVVNPDLGSTSIPLKGFRAIKPGYVYLDRYTVRDELGKGSMGVVYRCYDEIAGIDVSSDAECSPRGVHLDRLARSLGHILGGQGWAKLGPVLYALDQCARHIGLARPEQSGIEMHVGFGKRWRY